MKKHHGAPALTSSEDDFQTAYPTGTPSILPCNCSYQPTALSHQCCGHRGICPTCQEKHDALEELPPEEELETIDPIVASFVYTNMADYHADMRLNDEDYDDDIPDEESLDSIAANLGDTSMADYYADVGDDDGEEDINTRFNRTPLKTLAPSDFVWPHAEMSAL